MRAKAGVFLIVTGAFAVALTGCGAPVDQCVKIPPSSTVVSVEGAAVTPLTWDADQQKQCGVPSFTSGPHTSTVVVDENLGAGPRVYRGLGVVIHQTPPLVSVVELGKMDLAGAREFVVTPGSGVTAPPSDEWNADPNDRVALQEGDVTRTHLAFELPHPACPGAVVNSTGEVMTEPSDWNEVQLPGPGGMCRYTAEVDLPFHEPEVYESFIFVNSAWLSTTTIQVHGFGDSDPVSVEVRDGGVRWRQSFFGDTLPR